MSFRRKEHDSGVEINGFMEGQNNQGWGLIVYIYEMEQKHRDWEKKGTRYQLVTYEKGLREERELRVQV